MHRLRDVRCRDRRQLTDDDQNTFVAEYALPAGSSDGSGLAIVDGTGTAWIGTPSGTAFELSGLPCH